MRIICNAVFKVLHRLNRAEICNFVSVCVKLCSLTFVSRAEQCRPTLTYACVDARTHRRWDPSMLPAVQLSILLQFTARSLCSLAVLLQNVPPSHRAHTRPTLNTRQTMSCLEETVSMDLVYVVYLRAPVCFLMCVYMRVCMLRQNRQH